MRTVLTTATHTGSWVGVLYGIILLKFVESRLDTIRNKILRTTFNIQGWNKMPWFMPFNLNNEWTPQTNTGCIWEQDKDDYPHRLDLYTTCISRYYKQILNVSKILKGKHQHRSNKIVSSFNCFHVALTSKSEKTKRNANSIKYTHA